MSASTDDGLPKGDASKELLLNCFDPGGKETVKEAIPLEGSHLS